MVSDPENLGTDFSFTGPLDLRALTHLYLERLLENISSKDFLCLFDKYSLRF